MTAEYVADAGRLCTAASDGITAAISKELHSQQVGLNIVQQILLLEILFYSTKLPCMLSGIFNLQGLRNMVFVFIHSF